MAEALLAPCITDMFEAGAALPALTVGPITRRDLALFAGASNDYNALHIDIDAARDAGMDDVFAQGMLPMAYLARVLTDLVPQSCIRSWGVRFGAITHVAETLVLGGTVRSVEVCGSERHVHVDLKVTNTSGEVKLAGDAVLAI